jgi:hypothetical protein
MCGLEVSVEGLFGKVRRFCRTFPKTLSKMASEAVFWKGVLQESSHGTSQDKYGAGSW